MNKLKDEIERLKKGCGNIIDRDDGRIHKCESKRLCKSCGERIDQCKKDIALFKEILNGLKAEDREGLGKLPYPINIEYQTAWLLGYADSWTRVWRKLDEAQGDKLT